MERVTFTNSRNLTLVGNLYSSDSESIVIMCHGMLSDKDSRGRAEKLIKAFNKSGYNALTFDFSGCGESEDDSLTVSKEVDDLKSAIAFVKSKGFDKIALYGHSLGSLICLKCYTPEIQAIALSGACTGPVKYNWDEEFSKEQMEELREKGYITVNKNDGIRRRFIIDKQLLLDFELTNQKELLKNIACPVLIIHGNNDDEELLLTEISKNAVKLLPNDSKLEIIDGANHSMFDQFHIVVNLVNDWFIKYLNH